jgi:cell division initiation protein
MKITPLDIEGHTFSRKIRGFDRDEVRAFLSLVAEEYEKLIAENNQVKDEMGKMQSILDEHRQREKILRDTLYTAQQVSEDMKEAARREGRVVLQEAQIKADRVLDHAQSRAGDLEASIVELRMEKEVYLRRVRTLLEHHQKLLDLHEQSLEDEKKLHVMKRREGAEGSA